MKNSKRQNYVIKGANIKKAVLLVGMLSLVLFLNACQINYQGFLSNEERDNSESSTSASQEWSQEMQDAEDQKWLDDLEQLKHDITWYNTSPFERYGEEAFNKLYDEIYQEIPNLTDNEREYRFRELVYSIGDGHIDIWRDEESDYSLPIMIDELYDGFYVVNALDHYEGMIGEKVETINGQKIEDLIKKLEKISNSENEYWQRAGAIDKIHHKFFYELLDIERSDGKVLINDKNLDFIDAGSDDLYFSWYRDLDICYLPNSSVSAFYTYFSPYEYGFLEKEFVVEAGEVLYLRFSSCYYEDETYPLTDFAEDLLNDALKHEPRVLIVDLRNNGGGNSSQIYAALTDKFFEQTSFVDNGNIFVVTNNNTFSAGAITAHVLKDKFGATIIGTPTGGSPFTTGVTDTANKVLKNTGINFRVSSAKVGKKMIANSSEIPDYIVRRTHEDIVNYNDPVLEYILQTID